jgi:tetratricopeptide (TPR) repeat protein
MRRGLLALVAMAAVVLSVVPVAVPARADVSTIWDKAKNPPKPGLLSADEVHRQVAVLYHQAIFTQVDNPLFGGQAQAALEGARAILVRNEASQSSDPRLRYDYGLVLARLRRYPDAVVALEGALSFAKDHPFAEDGAFELALCYSHLGRHQDEERAYLVALEVTDRDSHKAVVYSNLAESRMAQGKLVEGIDAAERAIELEPDLPSARLNLAILEDRNGNPAGAVEAARHALELDPDSEFLDGDGVFFEPVYEKHWYVALRELALAERSFGDERQSHLMAALVAYRKWLDLAEPTDRFRPSAEEAVARLEKLLKLKPPMPAKKKK